MTACIHRAVCKFCMMSLTRYSGVLTIHPSGTESYLCLRRFHCSIVPISSVPLLLFFHGRSFSYSSSLLPTGLSRNHPTAIIDSRWDDLHSMEQRQQTSRVCIRYTTFSYFSVQATLPILFGRHQLRLSRFAGCYCIQEVREHRRWEIEEFLLVEGITSIQSEKHRSGQRTSLQQVFLGKPSCSWKRS